MYRFKKHTLDALIKPKARVMFELLRALFRDVAGAVVDQPHCACSEAKRMVKSMAREEDLADFVVTCEDALCTLGKKPLVKPPASISAFRVDRVFVCDAEDMPDSRDLGVVAQVAETSMHHLQPDFPRTRVVVA